MKKTLLLLLFLMTAARALAQQEWNNWYYWQNGLLTFKNGFPEIVHNFIQPVPTQYDMFNYYYWGYFRESVSYSDPATGNMRFLVCAGMAFGPDYKAFPANHTQFLRACTEDINAYHIIPFHNNPNKFYVIQFQDCISDLVAAQTGLQVRCPNAIGLGYSIVDMSLNGGNGDFTTINQQITSNLSAQTTTVKHANGKDVWVIVHPYNSGTFSAWLITDNGIGAAVNTDIGPMVSGSYLNHVGTLTASRDGKLLAGFSSAASAVQLFNFDNATGTLSNYRTLPYKEYVINMQFSPDDSKLYYCGYNSMYQYDLSKPDIGNSLIKIASSSASMTSMQLATDGKIYVNGQSFFENTSFKDYTGAIECPNLPEYACNFNPKALPEGGMNFMTLINDIIKDPKAPLITKFGLGNDTNICKGSLTLKAPLGWQNYKWNTGEITPDITIDSPGVYYVLTGNTGFNCPSGYGYINIYDTISSLKLGPDSVICAETNYRLHINDNFSNILWENGSSTRDSILTIAGVYKISAVDKGGCPTIDSFKLSVNNFVQAQFGNDTAICNGSALVLQLLPAGITPTDGNYLWQDGSVKDNYVVSKTGLYWGTVNYEGCAASDTIRVQYLDQSGTLLGSDTSFCNGDSLLLKTPVANAFYVWSTGETTQQIAVKQPGIYSVKVTTGIACALFDTIQITTTRKPCISLGNDTALCSNDALLLSPIAKAGLFKWQDGSASDNFTVRSPGLYWLQYTLNNCSTTDSIYITYKKTPIISIGEDTILCQGHTILLEIANPAFDKYEWQDGSTSPEYLVSNAGLYSVTATGINGCSNKDSILITTRQLPKASITGDSVLCKGYAILLIAHVTESANFSWQSGSTSLQFSVNTPGIYMLNARNECGTTTAKINIVEGLCSLILPTAFSPNKDRNDDIFKIKYPFATKQFLLTVYNRWGQKIFESADMRQGWDGTYHGQLQPVGSYIWFVSLVDEDGHNKNVHGSVLLIR